MFKGGVAHLVMSRYTAPVISYLHVFSQRRQRQWLNDNILFYFGVLCALRASLNTAGLMVWKRISNGGSARVDQHSIWALITTNR